MPSVLEQEIESEAHRSLPAAILDESAAPETAVLSRFTGSRMLRGKIECTDGRWLWHFVLDTEARHDGCAGMAASYQLARSQLVQELDRVNVKVSPRSSSPLPKS